MAKVSRGGQRKASAVTFSDLDSKLWWEYRKYSDEELTTIDTFLLELPKDFSLSSDMYENVKLLYKSLGLHHHPFLNYPLKKTISPENLAAIQQAIATAEANNAKKGAVPMEKPEIPECEVLQINNIKVDPVVLKLIAFCWSHSKLTNLKFTRNQLEERTEEALINTVSNPSLKLNKLFLDWNPPVHFEIYPKILTNPYIQFLSLRSSNISDSNLEVLVTALKENTTLKSLDLYGNTITGVGVDALATLIESACCLEFVGLAKNRLGKWSDVENWFDNLGKFPITPEEAEEIKLKEKEREAIIQKNQKNKGKKGYVDEPVPFLFPAVQTQDGSWAIAKGNRLKMISLALNAFDAESLSGIDRLLSKQDDDFHLILSDNAFVKKDIEHLKQKHQNKILL